VAIDVEMFTVGAVRENCFLVRAGADRDHAVIVDPGDEAPRLLQAIEDAGVTLDAILLTHTHFDHVGAVAPVARATGAPVYCPELEVPVLQDIMAFVPWPGFGPFESWDPEQTIAGGETLELAGLTLDVIFTPGHSPGHVTYAVRGEPALFSGDVLFRDSIGRTDLPYGDTPTLMRSIASLLERFDDDTVVYPGHMGLTTLGRERAHNPFVLQLANLLQ
jgi:hydroxyacylglutathione hydrolase